MRATASRRRSELHRKFREVSDGLADAVHPEKRQAIMKERWRLIRELQRVDDEDAQYQRAHGALSRLRGAGTADAQFAAEYAAYGIVFRMIE